MRIGRALGFALLSGAFGMLLTAPVQAGEKYQSSIVEHFPNLTAFSFTKSASKVSFKPSTKLGDGGMVTQLNVKFIDCPPNNDKGLAGKCGVSGNPITNHVMELGISFLGGEIDGAAGLKYQIEKGKVTFPSTGKNKIGGAFFGPLVTIIFDRPLGIGIIKLRTPGTVPSDCDMAPPGPGCLDGTAYALAGVTVGHDDDITCTTDAECSTTATCEGGACTPEPCTMDSDCDEGGGVGTGECGSEGTCCDPDIDATCAGQVP